MISWVGLYQVFFAPSVSPRSKAARHALCNRSILVTSNLTVHSEGARANYLHGQVFSHCSCTGKNRVSTTDLFICLGVAVAAGLPQ